MRGMETQTVTLSEFLLARIAEDEAAAGADLSSDAWGNPYSDGTGIELTFTGERVLAECDAKRRIVERHSGSGITCPRCSLGTEGGQIVFEREPCETLRALALPYADHPDFQPEWKP